MTNFYIDKDFQELSPIQKLIMNYLIYGNRVNNTGCFDLPIAQIAQDIGLNLEETNKTIQELINLGHVTKCSISNYILVTKFLIYNPLLDYKSAVELQSQAALLPISKDMYWQLYHLLGQQITQTKSFAIKNKRQLSKITADPELTGRSGRGTRIEKDWRPTRDDIDFATKGGLSEQEIFSIGAKFRDYWLQRPGPSGRKVDWHATWRMWITRHLESVGGGKQQNLANRILHSIGGNK